MNYYRLIRSSFIIIIPLFINSCKEESTLFTSISSSSSGINFRNNIIENDSVNQLDIENVYNGGGVGIGDFNKDGLPDIFFTGNVVPSKLYLNKSDFRFTDITEQAGINTSGKWCRGVAVIDINCDEWPDIYISVTLKKNPADRINLLYINHGLNSEGIPVFKEEARTYSLDDDSHTTQAFFFDYDNDGDLDVYLVVNEINERYSPYMFRPVIRNGRNPSTGKLLRNDWNNDLGHPVFTDVSSEAGILTEGYGHSAFITDINNDGWKDIYVGNDFFTNDLLWINNGNGTFTDRLQEYFKHTSANTMGTDFGDINNDGLFDIITLDMNPEDNLRKKMMLPPARYQIYQYTEQYNYSYQYVRNIIQLNQGNIAANDTTSHPFFSDIGYYAGITATDWSWSPLLADFDYDGFADLIICNGFPKDITDHDFAMFRTKAYKVASKNEILSQVPVVKLHNYAFRNNGDLTFSDVSESWGMTTPSFSNGAAFADFDLDGDLDLVMNNINDVAYLYRNNIRETSPEKSNYLNIRLAGDSLNRDGIGSLVSLYFDNGKTLVRENTPFRGYLSTLETTVYFGMGLATKADSVVIRWQNGLIQKIYNVGANQSLTVSVDSAGINEKKRRTRIPSGQMFDDFTGESGIDHFPEEEDFVDFNIQKLIPHKYSESGPYIAAGDVDGNGLEDIVCGGSSGHNAMAFLQQANGKFISRPLDVRDKKEKTWDDAGILLLDADNDGDLDIYIASGGYENEPGSSYYSDHLYVNDGTGIFIEDTSAIPSILISKSCVISADFDQDGDQDLFIGGRIDPWHYPRPVSSYVLRNDSHRHKILFTDITAESAPELISLGMVNDAVFSDYDNDGWTDLVIAGEWMPLTFFKNINGRFINKTSGTGIEEKTGWWRSVIPCDFDKDGDMDYVSGNLGLNSFYRASGKYPVSVYSADYDNNGSYDAFLSIYLPSSQEDRTIREYPSAGREDAVKQMISLRSRFQNYKSYAVATIDQLFSPEQFGKSLVLRATCFESSCFRNEGNGRFKIIPLPAEAQMSPLNFMITEDFNHDGNADIAITGNDFGTEVLTGRYDAFNGLVLLGDGNNGFRALSVEESGFFVPGNGRGLVKLKDKQGSLLLAAAQNRGKLRIFKLNNIHIHEN